MQKKKKMEGIKRKKNSKTKIEIRVEKGGKKLTQPANHLGKHN